LRNVKAPIIDWSFRFLHWYRKCSA